MGTLSITIENWNIAKLTCQEVDEIRMSNSKDDSDTRNSDSKQDDSSTHDSNSDSKQDDSSTLDSNSDYDNELNGNTFDVSYHCEINNKDHKSSNRQSKLNNKQEGRSCAEKPGYENKQLISGVNVRDLGGKVSASSRRKNKGLKHNSKIWDNLKFSSEAVNSESSSGYTEIKQKNKGKNDNNDKSEDSAGLALSLDLPDNLKKSLQKIVQTKFTSGGKDNSVNKLRDVAGYEDGGDISLKSGGETRMPVVWKNSMFHGNDANDLHHGNILCSYTSEQESINELDVSNYAFIRQNQGSESPSSLQGQNIHKPKRYGQRPQICGHCGKLFLDPYNFKQHLLIHSGEKPFKCDICGRGFSRNNHLTRHILIHTGEKPFHCDICGSDFSRSSTLALHKRSHTKEKNYNCKICGKDFTLYWNLVVHLRIHTGERPFKCEICQKTSRQKSDFNRHMKTHSGEKPFTCYTCNTKFSRSSCLKRHWNKFHPNKPIEENLSTEENDETIHTDIDKVLMDTEVNQFYYGSNEKISEKGYVESEGESTKPGDNINIVQVDKQTYELTFS